MVITTEYAEAEVGGSPMRMLVCAPRGEGVWPGVLCYSDIFQLTGPTVRACARLAGYGFVVAAPEIYHRLEPRGGSPRRASASADTSPSARPCTGTCARPPASTRPAFTTGSWGRTQTPA